MIPTMKEIKSLFLHEIKITINSEPNRSKENLNINGESVKLEVKKENIEVQS